MKDKYVVYRCPDGRIVVQNKPFHTSFLWVEVGHGWYDKSVKGKARLRMFGEIRRKHEQIGETFTLAGSEADRAIAVETAIARMEKAQNDRARANAYAEYLLAKLAASNRISSVSSVALWAKQWAEVHLAKCLWKGASDFSTLIKKMDNIYDLARQTAQEGISAIEYGQKSTGKANA